MPFLYFSSLGAFSISHPTFKAYSTAINSAKSVLPGFSWVLASTSISTLVLVPFLTAISETYETRGVLKGNHHGTVKFQNQRA